MHCLKTGQKVDVQRRELLLLEGSASIRTVPLERFNERMGREKPSQFGLIACRKARSDRFALHWIQEIHRRTFLIKDHRI
jgi:hypothetical protein